MSAKIKFAIVGCGHIGKRHAAMIQNNEHCQLTALSDIRPVGVLGLEEYASIPFFSSLKELLESNAEVDVVCICSPNEIGRAHV